MAMWSRSRFPASACYAILSGTKPPPAPRARPRADRSNNKKEDAMNLPKHLLPTTVVGSYPQPDWLVDRAMLSKSVPRVRMDIWRVAPQWLEQAQDDATILAIRAMERAGIDIIT